ncbi:chromate transporter [Clostridium sp. 1001271B_151109_B4]|uniref:chromate transporter n=1 Tax=Clostridium sp. 1001271B_151109_B4 TaxID=2787148 RepID=UPI0018A950BD|nr:chromate transporter [Clostridium sp. 1001271B_151109_B4]
MIYLTLFLEFFKVGLFSVGGGLATIPFLSELATKYSWFDQKTLMDMIAVSQSTPGAIGVNMATFAGFKASGILGSIIATLGLVTPSVIVIIIVAHFLNKFKESRAVESIFYGLRPAVAALIASAGYEVFKVSILAFDKFNLTHKIIDTINIKSTILLIILLFAITKFKKHPIFYIASAALIGIIFKF